MNRTTFALFVALLIHLVFVLLFWILMSINPEHKKKPVKENRMRVSLKEMPKKHKDSALKKKKVPKTKIIPPIPKGKQLKKIVKPPVKFKPEQPKKTPKLNKPSKSKPIVKPKQKIEPLPSKKQYIPLYKEKEVVKVKKKEKDQMAWMYEDKSEKTKPEVKKAYSKMGAGGSLSEMKKLYGRDWTKLTNGQQKYMIDNQEVMRRITQSVLTRVASVNLSNNINVNRTNVIEFYLHPNGDMTDFRFLSKSGFFVLDETTKETIEYAYSRYPRPKEKILIRYNVYYNLARY